MKKTILSALFLSLSVSMMAVQAANNDASVKAQLDSQKDLVTDNNFYPANNVFYTAVGIFVPTFKDQLDSQKAELTDYTFYPATAVSYKKTLGTVGITEKQNVYSTKEGVFVPSFKEQLDSQKSVVTDYKFYPANNVYYTEEGVYVPSFKQQLDSQKSALKDYKFYPANNVSYN